jgi:hypothetical protein
MIAHRTASPDLRATAIVAALDRAMRRSDGAPRSSATARIVAGRKFIPADRRNPVGAGNAKTNVPSTYRPVGVAGSGRGTCPATCAYLSSRTCYAMSGRTAIQEASSSSDTVRSLNAAAIAMVAAAMGGQQARLHVSGDLMSAESGGVDAAYVAGLAAIARAIRARYGVDTVAWTYTHAIGPDIDAARATLIESGVFVRLSDRPVAGGAIVSDARASDVRRATGVPSVLCPAQLTRNAVTCARCLKCSDPTLLVVFRGEGARKRAAIAASPSAI